MAVASPTISLSPSATSSVTASPDLNRRSNCSRSEEDVEIPTAAALKSEEYRQLFRLPPAEVLIEDFNCACQENILIQGHMYLFNHYICFYSNIFGFETKKVIPIEEVTGVQRAKTAGIFPNAIEIIAGDKKHFFASFLSRDEAFKIINDGWLRHGTAAQALTEQQESVVEPNSQENGLVTQMDKGSGEFVVDDIADRNENDSNSRDSEVASSVEHDTVAMNSEAQPNAKDGELAIVNGNSSSNENALTWKEEIFNAPAIPESFMRVAESRFAIKVEDLFSFFFSDDAFSFIESFHKRCGDRDFRCSKWYVKENGHARDVSFQHPIKVYLGAKLGSCQELQTFRLYRDSHLVIETSQEINDVPYGDYFCVQGLWDVERDNSESTDCCILRVYVNVAFSKKTMFRGKIVQSTLEECRETYSIWMDMAHELLKQKRLERQEANPDSSMVQNHEVQLDTRAEALESSEVMNGSNSHLQVQPQSISKSANVNQEVDGLTQGSNTSLSRESILKLMSYLGHQKQLPLLLTITFIMIILMQVSILVLLGRPQNVQVISPVGYGNNLGSGPSYDAYEWLEKRIYNLKDEMLITEARLERMRHEHELLKAQLKDIELLVKHR